jgi:acyl-CoA hydrolase
MEDAMTGVTLPQHLRDRVVTNEEALRAVLKKGARVASGFATSEPHTFYDTVWDHVVRENVTDVTFVQALFMAPHPLLMGDTMRSRGLLDGLAQRLPDRSPAGKVARKVNLATRKVQGLRRLVRHYEELKARNIRFVAGFMGAVNNIVIPHNALTGTLFAEYVGRNTSRLGITDMHSVHFPDGVGAVGFDADGVRKVDTFVLVMTPPDKDGLMSHGPANGANSDVLERALAGSDIRLLLYVNPRYPFVRGWGDAFNTVHADAFRGAAREGRLLVVEDEGRIPALPANSFADPDPREVAIADNVVNHIEQHRAYTFGRALQVGFGGTGVLAIRGLKKSSWQGRVYTEMLEPFTWDLLESGKVSGSHMVETDGRRTQLDGKVVATFSVAEEGSDFYAKLDHNPAVVMAPASRVVVSEGFYGGLGINNCLSIDFHGQVNAGGRGRNHHSGIGGAAMIHRGLANGGVAYLCLKSTHVGLDGRVASSIAPFTPYGTPISLIGPDVTGGRNGSRFFLATEHGVACLSGCSQSQLIKALIQVADPAFRDDLKAAAWQEFRVRA